MSDNDNNSFMYNNNKSIIICKNILYFLYLNILIDSYRQQYILQTVIKSSFANSSKNYEQRMWRR